MTTYNIAIVGATGVVGKTTLSILEERQFPIGQLYLLGSKRSTGDTLEYKGKHQLIHDLAEFDFSKADISFFCAGNDISAEYAPKAAKAGSIVIDKSSHFRCDPDVPLVVPEVNASSLDHFRKKNIISSPNCNTIPVVVALKPIHDVAGIKRINIATYQSVSGAGKDGVTELAEQTMNLLSGKPIKSKVFPQQIAFNVLPHIDDILENGYTKEEMKLVLETQKILDDDTIAINPTAVRVPVFYGHSAAVHIETDKKISAKQATQLLNQAPGVKLIKGKFPYPTPVKNSAGEDDVFVGRIREDISHPHGLDLWVVADNLRKGAALNAIQIAELLIKNYL